jgi:iron complex outermembrane receptor protein
MSTLAELLSNESCVHVKSYGNNNIATTSVRGGNANHTAVIWNGLSIQNPMLGQSDISLIQTNLFDQFTLEFGGGSSAWGSGAIGASIHLQNNILFNEGLKTKIQLSSGSFGTTKLNTLIKHSSTKFYSSTRFYFNQSKNNYTYLDTTNKEITLQEVKHAEIITKGFLQEMSYVINSKNRLHARIWYNATDRNIPSFTTQSHKKNQFDQSTRCNVDWEIKTRNMASDFRLAYFNDILNYNDSIANIFSNSSVNTFILESNHDYKLKYGSVHFGINNTLYQTNTENYNTLHKLNKLAFFTGYQVSLLKTKLNYSIFFRKEITNQTVIPLTGNSGLTYVITKHYLGKINISQSYRQPSLNDLYWKQGGNPNLKSEDSKEIEGGVVAKFDFQNIKLRIEANYFNRQTNNWIIWLPGDNGYWTPQNLQQVHSRGSDTKTSLSYSKNNLFLKVDVNTSYVLSTNTKNTSVNDNSNGKQIIYSPRYAGNATCFIQFKKVMLYYMYNYTGYRFTSTDNTSWLMPYQISNLKLSTYTNFSKTKLTIFAACNNLQNKNYVVVSNTPMPLRNFEFGCTIEYLKKNKLKNNNL